MSAPDGLWWTLVRVVISWCLNYPGYSKYGIQKTSISFLECLPGLGGRNTGSSLILRGALQGRGAALTGGPGLMPRALRSSQQLIPTRRSKMRKPGLASAFAPMAKQRIMRIGRCDSFLCHAPGSPSISPPCPAPWIYPRITVPSGVPLSVSRS